MDPLMSTINSHFYYQSIRLIEVKMHFFGKDKFYVPCYPTEKKNTITTYHTLARLSGLLSFLSLDQ